LDIFGALSLLHAGSVRINIPARTVNHTGDGYDKQIRDSFEAFKKKFVVVCNASREVRDSVVGWGIMLRAGRWRVRFPIRSLDFSIDLILQAAQWPWGQLSL
jgi:hypothetical protein